MWEDLVEELENSLDELCTARYDVGTEAAIIKSVTDVVKNLRETLEAIESEGVEI